MHIQVGSILWAREIKVPRIPQAVAEIVAKAPKGAGAVLTFPGITPDGIPTVQPSGAGLCLATVDDLPGIIKLVSSYPDNASDASDRGFLRGRFTKDEYTQLIDDGCVHVVRRDNEVIAFASVLPWKHPLLSLERLVVSLKLGPFKIASSPEFVDNFQQIRAKRS